MTTNQAIKLKAGDWVTNLTAEQAYQVLEVGEPRDIQYLDMSSFKLSKPTKAVSIKVRTATGRRGVFDLQIEASRLKKLKAPKTIHDLRRDPRIDQIDNEGEDGYWCYLRAGFQDGSNPTSHTIHEHTIQAVCEYMASVEFYPDDPELECN